MKTILITGGAGFIGSCLVRQFVTETNDSVICLDKLTYAGNLDSLAPVVDSPRFEFIRGDVCDGQLVTRILRDHSPTAVIHLAAESHVDRSIDRPAPFVQTNIVGTATLLEASLEFWRQLPPDKAARFRMLHVSTDEVYGSLGATGRFSESSPYSPNSPYAASKAAADHLVRAYHHTYGFPALVTNCSNNFGPYQFPEKLIPLTILNALRGQPLPVYGDGQNVRDWLYVEDHCQALRCVLERGEPGEVYNIGGNAERTNLDVVRAICRLVDRLRPDLPHRPTDSLITCVADRPGHDRRYAIDSSKLEQTLGWRPVTEFDAGLERTVGWYLNHSAWVDRVTSGVYRGERLGLATNSGGE